MKEQLPEDGVKRYGDYGEFVRYSDYELLQQELSNVQNDEIDARCHIACLQRQLAELTQQSCKHDFKPNGYGYGFQNFKCAVCGKIKTERMSCPE